MPFSAKNEVPRVARVSHVSLAACKLRSSALCTVLYFAPFKARSAKCGFRLLLGGGSAIIRPVSRKEILETLIFDIPAAVKGAAGWLARIGWCGVGQDSLGAWARGVYLPRLSAGLCTRFRVLSFKRKTANFSETKRSTRARHVCIHVAHSLVCVLFRALSGASLKT